MTIKSVGYMVIGLMVLVVIAFAWTHFSKETIQIQENEAGDMATGSIKKHSPLKKVAA